MNQMMHWLVSITLIEMMIAIGLGVSWNELMLVAKNPRLILGSVIANYICVPAATLVLVLVSNSRPFTAAGFLILAVCPGASYGPPFTALGKGKVSTSVGLMVLLAGSSAIVAPLLLHLFLPLLSGQERATIDLRKMLVVLAVTQFAPLCFGLSIRHWWPLLADKLRGPAQSAGLVLNILLVGWLLATHYSLFAQLDLRGVIGISALLAISLGAGWLFGGPETENRKALALTSSLRNIGLSLVIATGAFPGTPAITAVLGYGLFEIAGSLVLAAWWHRSATATTTRDSRLQLLNEHSSANGTIAGFKRQ